MSRDPKSPVPTRPRARASAVTPTPRLAVPTSLPGPQPYLLGEWLVRRGVLTRHQLFLALSTSHQLQCRLGDAAIVMGFVPPNLLEAEAEILEGRRREAGIRRASSPGGVTRPLRRGRRRRIFAGYAWGRGGLDTVEHAV